VIPFTFCEFRDNIQWRTHVSPRAVYTYCPVCVKLDTADLHVMLVFTARSSVTVSTRVVGINAITSTRVP